jgi:hypothetical protein
MSRVAAVCVLALSITATAAAQEPVRPPAETAKPRPADVPPKAEAPGQPVNVKLDFTILDQSGAGEPARRTVTLIVADRSAGSIRSIGNSVRATLNVDATPHILANGSIRVQVGLEYNPRQVNAPADKVKLPGGEVAEVGGPGAGGSALNQRTAIVLVPGKPLVLSQAADPLSDRKITVEVRAEILK